MTTGQTIIDPASKRVGRIVRVTPARLVVRDEHGCYFYVKLTPWGQPIGGGVNPELLVLAGKHREKEAAAT